MAAHRGRTAALATLAAGGAVAIVAWAMLIHDLLAWQDPLIAVVPTVKGTVLPRVSVVSLPAGVGAAASTGMPSTSAPSSMREEAARAATDGTAAEGARAAGSPAPDRSALPAADVLTDVRERLARLSEPIASRTTGTAPPRIPLPTDVVCVEGMRVRGVNRVAYILDCSARSAGLAQRMADAVVRSARRLDDSQSFAVIVARRGGATIAPPGAMRRGGTSFQASAADDLRAWLLESMAPEGEPLVLPGIDAAMSTRPDLVVLVSAGLAGPGDADDVRDAALAACNRANPRDASGRRPARIMAVTAGGEDPRGVLAAIAAAHGDGTTLIGALMAETAGGESAPGIAAAEGAAGTAGGDRALVDALRAAMRDPADPESAQSLLRAAVLAQSMGWPAEHVARLAQAAARRAEALGLDATAAEARSIRSRALGAEAGGQP